MSDSSRFFLSKRYNFTTDIIAYDQINNSAQQSCEGFANAMSCL